ncbi:class II fumarate hydratase [Leuconostoc pseudomesenteroides]|uniref:class II fumarate hydratase n=1 Tax=Leuconostoc pseudomesenteroides TaxID=33968 RepID=UPI0039EADBFF
MAYHIEEDAIGPVKVPNDVLWGPQTQRSHENFKIGGRMPYPVIKAILHIKKAAALTNAKLGELSQAKADLIVKTVDELLMGKYQDQFPLVVYQTGSGTQTNMNVNEVIAHLAAKIQPDLPLLPNDDINHSQSSNDTFPTAMAIAAFLETVKLLPILKHVKATFDQKAQDYKDVIKIGRTHLQDATPMTVGQEISGWASGIQHNIDYLELNLPTLLELPIGGTAVGTGLNTAPDYDVEVVKKLAELYGVSFVNAPNKFQGMAEHSGLNMVHSVLKTLSADLVKIGNDIRFLASGPRAGYGEFNIPANEPGSSIMPGKVNPTQIEALTMVAATVFGHDATINFAASQGNFEMNVYKPVIIATYLDSVSLLQESIQSWDDKLVAGLTINPDRMKALVDQSLMTVTALSPHIGYETSAHIAQKAQKEGTTLREAAIASGKITAADFDKWVVPADMTHPRIK